MCWVGIGDSLPNEGLAMEISHMHSLILNSSFLCGNDNLAQACMDRDREEGYFERQARTMDIIGTYVTEDAPSKVDLSEDCRVRILASEVSRWVSEIARGVFLWIFSGIVKVVL